MRATDVRSANSDWPIVKLRPIGDGCGLVRVLVEVLVRRALINNGVIRDSDTCEIQAPTEMIGRPESVGELSEKGCDA
jgi:hypothetical protein